PTLIAMSRLPPIASAIVKSELMGIGDARMPVQTLQVSKQTLMRAMVPPLFRSQQRAGRKVKGISDKSALQCAKMQPRALALPRHSLIPADTAILRRLLGSRSPQTPGQKPPLGQMTVALSFNTKLSLLSSGCFCICSLEASAETVSISELESFLNLS